MKHTREVRLPTWRNDNYDFCGPVVGLPYIAFESDAVYSDRADRINDCWRLLRLERPWCRAQT